MTTPRDRRALDAADRRLLRSAERPRFRSKRGCRPVRVVDLFSGCGGMTLGLEMGAAELRRRVECLLAMDLDPAALAIHERNFPGGVAESAPVESFFDGELGAALTSRERKTRRDFPDVDILMGGPPCQGHSNLNNHTRRRDPRNALYARMARAARVLRPRFVIIENVTTVVHDRGGIVQATRDALRSDGYRTFGAVIPMVRVGVPQRRRRHVLLASLEPAIEPSEVLSSILESTLFDRPRTVGWAISDLVASNSGKKSVFDSSSVPSAENQRRIDYLFRHDLHRLPNSQRPPCHRHGNHSYYSIYGRMSWDEPAQTITTGFSSMGQGCYVHPKRPRTISPHEAARLQTFPDYFDFGAETRRTTLAKVIGNAVPPFFMREIARHILPALT